MSLYSQLRELLDDQNTDQLEEFLTAHPHLDLNHTTQTGLSALWYAMHPPKNKRPSATIIQYLINSKRVDTSQMLYQQHIRHVAKSPILELLERLGNPWKAPSAKSSEVPVSESPNNNETEYQLFSAKVLNQLMHDNLSLFNKYLYYYQLRGLPLGAPETAPIDEEIRLWVEEQRRAFAIQMNHSIEGDVIHMNSTNPGLSNTPFNSLNTLTILARSQRKGKVAYRNCLLHFENQPLVAILQNELPISELIAAICNKLIQKLAPSQYLAEIQSNKFIKSYVSQLSTSEQKSFAKKLWVAALNLPPRAQKISNDVAFLTILETEFNTLCPSLYKWLTHLATEERLRFFKEYLQKNKLLQRNELIHFANYWALYNQHIERFDFNNPIQFQNQDFRGVDLSKIDLTHIEFINCDLRLSHIVANPTLKKSHLSNNNLLEDALWVYACLNQNVRVMNYFLDKDHSAEFLNNPVDDSGLPILITLVSEQKATSVGALLAANHSQNVIQFGEHNAFTRALQLGNQDVIREFYRVNMTYPNSYALLYTSEDDELANAKRLLLDYTKNNQLVLRWLHGHFNRHHIEEVTAIIQKIDANKITHVDELLSELKKIKLLNHTGSLARRIMFMEENNKRTPEENSCFKMKIGCFG